MSVQAGLIQRLVAPLTFAALEKLRAGDEVRLSGSLLAARDAAHRRMCEALRRGEGLPVEVRGQVIYYVGPTPARPGRPVGSAGPTTAGRMDADTLPLLERGLAGMIGKGRRSAEVRAAIRKHNAVYFAAVGGTGALLATRIKAYEVLAYPDLGPEALARLEVEDFPLIVAADRFGGYIYDLGAASDVP